MNHTSLKIFSVVAEELSVVKAAQRLGRVQSNITTRIQQLEEELDAELFIRDSKRLKLSPQGKLFLSYTKKLLSLGEEARQSLHPHTPNGDLALGSMECAAASRLTKPLAEFSQTCPEVRLLFSTQPTGQLIERVQQSELDCALVALPVNDAGETLCPDDLRYQPLYDEQLLLVLPTTMSHIRQLSDIDEGKLAAFAVGCTYRQLAMQMLQNMGASGRRIQVQDVSSYHAMLACVAAGTYMCMLPESVLQLLQLPAGLTLLPAGHAVTQLIWRKDYRSPALDHLRRLLANEANVSA